MSYDDEPICGHWVRFQFNKTRTDLQCKPSWKKSHADRLLVKWGKDTTFVDMYTHFFTQSCEKHATIDLYTF